MNVNKWLVVKGYARVVDYPNEFNPDGWRLYVSYSDHADRGCLLGELFEKWTEAPVYPSYMWRLVLVIVILILLLTL